jgi:hypothetical protein
MKDILKCLLRLLEIVVSMAAVKIMVKHTLPKQNIPLV